MIITTDPGYIREEVIFTETVVYEKEGLFNSLHKSKRVLDYHQSFLRCGTLTLFYI